ncbi:hypothetical protein CsatA_017247 [Cannabis sativa]
MGFVSNRVQRGDLKEGDHIYSYRAFHTYSHHGIYIGDNRVIHYTRTEPKPTHEAAAAVVGACNDCGYRPKAERGVVISCLDCFLINRFHRLFRFNYGVSSVEFFLKSIGTCSLYNRDAADLVVRRANQMLVQDKGNEGGNFGEYDILNNNCESFAVYCMTGNHFSAQAESLKTISRILFKNMTEKPLNLDNLLRTIAEMMFSYKIEVLRQHAVSESSGDEATMFV